MILPEDYQQAIECLLKLCRYSEEDRVELRPALIHLQQRQTKAKLEATRLNDIQVNLPNQSDE